MSRLDNNKRPTITDREFIMPFGKRKGWTIDEMIQNDPQYLAWLVNNTDFDVDFKLLEEAEEAAETFQP